MTESGSYIKQCLSKALAWFSLIENILDVVLQRQPSWKDLFSSLCHYLYPCPYIKEITVWLTPNTFLNLFNLTVAYAWLSLVFSVFKHQQPHIVPQLPSILCIPHATFMGALLQRTNNGKSCIATIWLNLNVCTVHFQKQMLSKVLVTIALTAILAPFSVQIFHSTPAS